MSWLTSFFTSSIGRKIIMSLTGLFLITFLLVHLTGNLQLLINDGGEKFNIYAKFMTTNPLIKTVSYLLYAGILLHAVQGWMLWQKNRASRGSQRYAVHVTRATNTSASAAKSMGWLGTIIFVFILIHMYQFWLQMKLGTLEYVTIEGDKVKDLYAPVAAAFKNIYYVIFYVFCMIVIARHLQHGFQSAFQTLGLNHRRWSPLIQTVGIAYSILVPLGFAIIPIYFYLFK